MGLDPGVMALVEVAGPGGYRRTLSGSTTLFGLVQGSYDLSARSVVHPGLPFVRYRPTRPAEGRSLGVPVGGANRPLTQVSYTRLPGTLRVAVAGLPAGLSASLQARGSFESYTFSLSSGERRLPVEAGRYTLEWPNLPDPAGSGEWVADRSGYSVDVPSEGEGDGGVVTYRFQSYPARLDLSVGNLSGSSLSPKVCVYPSDSPPVDPDANLDVCP